ncbi:DUF5680 domain-containing protein [Natrialba swarupiae]|uniref:DUF5680 domain-containing protein n=1 Tax=Natrialba swarupiae TaxID=2448032 RepID=UPI00192E58DD|nr:DUF5680 domain-containing protein [Natrialba swarupiae]
MGELSEFIADAHENGYATTDPDAGEERQGKVITDGRGNWQYRDTYHGSEAFVGPEVVFFDDEPVCGMSFYGDLATSSDSRARDEFGRTDDHLRRNVRRRPRRPTGPLYRPTGAQTRARDELSPNHRGVRSACIGRPASR